MEKIDKLIEEFLRYLLIDKGYSKNTIASYKIDLDKFNLYFKNKSNKRSSSVFIIRQITISATNLIKLFQSTNKYHPTAFVFC